MKTIILFGYNTEYDQINLAEGVHKMHEFIDKGYTPIKALEVRSDMTAKQVNKITTANQGLIDTANAIFVKVDREQFYDFQAEMAIGHATIMGKQIFLSKDTGARTSWPKGKATQGTIFDLMRGNTDLTKK